MTEELYYYCKSCGKSWRDDQTFIHEVECPECMALFWDDNVERIDYEEYLTLTYN